MEAKKVDGIKKIKNKDLQESRKIVLSSIEEEKKAKRISTTQKRSSKKVDGIFGIFKKEMEEEENLLNDGDIEHANEEIKESDISKKDTNSEEEQKYFKKQKNKTKERGGVSVDGLQRRNEDRKSKKRKEKKKRREEEIKIDSKKRNEWKREIEATLSGSKNKTEKLKSTDKGSEENEERFEKHEEKEQKESFFAAVFKKINLKKSEIKNRLDTKKELQELKRQEKLKAKFESENKIEIGNLEEKKAHEEYELKKNKQEAKEIKNRQEMESLKKEAEVESQKVIEVEKENKKIVEVDKKEEEKKQEKLKIFNEKEDEKRIKKLRRQEKKEIRRREKERKKEERLKEKESEILEKIERKRKKEKMEKEKEKKIEALREEKERLEERRKKEAEKKERKEERRKKNLLLRRRKKKKRKREESLQNLNKLVKNLSRSGKEKLLYVFGKTAGIFLISFVLFFFSYAIFIFFVLRFDFDNDLTRKIADYVFVPAFVSRDGVIDYFEYKDHFKKISLENNQNIHVEARLNFTKEFVYNNILKSHALEYQNYELLSEDEIEEIDKKMLADIQINQVAISRIKKIKEMINKRGDFAGIASKFGDKTGSIIVNENNKHKFAYLNFISDLEEGEISNLVVDNGGYYIFRVFEKSKDYLELNFVFVDGITLEEYVDEKVDGYKLWSFVN